MCEENEQITNKPPLNVGTCSSRELEKIDFLRKPQPDDLAGWTLLPADYSPSNMDIIVGTGREAKNHEGNARFRESLKTYIARYSNADSKLGKTLIISEIVQSIREESPTNTGFVKKVKGRWYAVDDHQSREKVSQGLRNILHDQYRSSARSKKRKRGMLCAQMQNSVDEMMQAKKSFLSERMGQLSAELAKKGKHATEEDVEALFTQANVAILEGLKSTEENKPCSDTGSPSQNECEDMFTPYPAIPGYAIATHDIAQNISFFSFFQDNSSAEK